MSRKGLERKNGVYREHIEGWTCEYYHHGGRSWDWAVWRSGRKAIAGGTCFGRMRFRQSVEHGWRWWIQDGDGEPAVDWGHAPTLAEARKAAREVCGE